MSRFMNVTYSYRALRGLQISTVFFFTFVAQELFRYPRAGWTGFAVMMIYAGFDNGTTIARAYHRFLGVLLGLFSGYLLWLLGHIDYRTLFLIIPITVFFAYYLAGRAYSVPTVFTVNTSLIGTAYFYSDDFPLTYFLMDYSICTVFAFAIILGIEYFWFRRYHLMHRFITDAQAEVIHNLYVLVELLNQNKIRRTVWFQRCIILTDSLFEVDKLIRNSQFMVSSERAVGDEFSQFVTLSNRIFIGLKALYISYHTKRYHKFDYYKLVEQVQTDLVRLRAFVVKGNAEPTLGAMYANPS